MRVPFQKTIAILLAPALFAACYTYVPVEPGAATPGSEVRARIAAQAAADIADSLGMGETRLLNGTLVAQQGGGITLNVQTAPQGTIGAPKGMFKQVTLTRAQLLELESVKLDRARTGIIFGAAAVGAGIALAVLHNKGTGSGPVSETGPNFAIGFLHLRF